MLQVDLGVIGKIFVVPIENRTYHRRFVWASKNIVEIVLEGIVLGKDIAPNLQKIRKDSLGQFTDASIYEDTAIAFIVFFALQIILDLMVWTFVVWTNGYDTSVAISVLLSVVSDMPIIICGVCLMKYNGIIDWRNQPMFELIFQRWFIFNIMLQITAGYAKKVRFILGPLSYLVACLPYAFVIISMSAEWYFFPWSNNYRHHNFIQGTFNSTQTQHMFDFLMLSGFIGQWIWLILSAIIFDIFLIPFVYVIFKKFWQIKLVLFITIGIIVLIIALISEGSFMTYLINAITLFIALKFWFW